MKKRACDKTPGDRWLEKLRATRRHWERLRDDGGTQSLADKMAPIDRVEWADELRRIASKISEHAAMVDA